MAKRRKPLIPKTPGVGLSPDEQTFQAPIVKPAKPKPASYIRREPMSRSNTATATELGTILGVTPAPPAPATPGIDMFGSPLNLAGQPARKDTPVPGLPTPADEKAFLSTATPAEKENYLAFKQSQTAQHRARGFANLEGKTQSFQDPLSPTGESFVGPTPRTSYAQRGTARQQQAQQQQRAAQQAVFNASPQGAQVRKGLLDLAKKDPSLSRAYAKQAVAEGWGDTAEGRILRATAATMPLSTMEKFEQRLEITEKFQIRKEGRVNTATIQKKRTEAEGINEENINTIERELSLMPPEILRSLAGQSISTGLAEAKQSMKTKDATLLVDKIKKLMKTASDLIGPIARKMKEQEAAIAETARKEEDKAAEVARKEERTAAITEAKLDVTESQKRTKDIQDRVDSLQKERVEARKSLNAALDKERVEKEKDEDAKGSQTETISYLENRKNEIDEELGTLGVGEAKGTGLRGELQAAKKEETTFRDTLRGLRVPPATPGGDTGEVTDQELQGSFGGGEVNLGTGEIVTPEPRQAGNASIDDLAKQIEDMVGQGLDWEAALDRLDITDPAIIEQITKFFQTTQ